MAEKTNVPEIRFAGFTDPWEQRKFSDMYVVNNERNANCELGYDRTLSIATMTFNGGNGAADDSLSNYKIIRIGDIAFEGHTNKVHAYGRFVLNDAGDGLMSPRFSCLRPIVEQRYSFWKYYIPREESMRPILVNATKSGTMMNELVPDDLMRESILVPCLAEQEIIGNSLSQLDHLITLHQRKYDKLAQLKKSMLDKMFPKPGERFPEIRFAGFTDPWEQRKLGELTTILSAARVHKEEWRTEGVPFYRSSDVMAAFNGAENEKVFISQELYERLGAQSGVPQKGDVMVTGGGSVGTPYIVPDDKPLYTKDADLIWIKRHAEIDPKFLYSFFVSPIFKSYIQSISHVGTIAHYTIEQVKETPLSMPWSIVEQKAVGSFFGNLDSLITLHQRKLELLRNTKKSLLDRMFV